jgi:small subunit ribosomal protein S6
MNHYELLYIIPLAMGEENIDTNKAKVDGMLKQAGAQITAEEIMGKKKLSYPIGQIRYGHYILTEFDLDPAKLTDLEREFRLSSDILRFQILAKKIKSPEQLAQEKALQEKLRQRARDEEYKPKMTETRLPLVEEKPEPTRLDDLDKKLEEILENEIVK